MTQQAKILLDKSKQYATEVMSNALNHSEAQAMYNGIYLPSITYPFPLTSLTPGQCHAIETPFFQAILPRCGYNRTMSRQVRFCPKSHGGAGFQSLYVEQSVQVILMALKHLRCPDHQPGQMLSIALSWAQAYTGVSWMIWQYPRRKIPRLPNPWITGVQKALAFFDSYIEFEDTKKFVPQLLRRQDWHIMDVVLQMNYTSTEIEDINACRRYYQATTMADIVDDQGTHIQHEVWYGIGTPHPDEFNQEFFNQVRPNSKALSTWRMFLQTKATPDRQLLVPLQNWTVNLGNCRRRPKWAFDPDTRRLFHRVRANQYVECQRVGHRYKPAPPELNLVVPPSSAYPTASETRNEKLKMTINRLRALFIEFQLLHNHQIRA